MKAGRREGNKMAKEQKHKERGDKAMGEPISRCVCVCVCVSCRIKCPRQSLGFPPGQFLINCPSSCCDSDYFNQDSQDTHPCPILHRKTPLLLCTQLPGWPSLTKIRIFFLFWYPPPPHSFFSCLFLAATNNLTSAPHSPCHQGIMSLCGRGVLEQRQGELKTAWYAVCSPLCVYTCSGDWLR